MNKYFIKCLSNGEEIVLKFKGNSKKEVLEDFKKMKHLKFIEFTNDYKKKNYGATHFVGLI